MFFFFERSLFFIFNMGNYGRLLTYIRVAKNLSQDDLAKIIGIDKSLVSRYESGHRNLHEAKFKEFCKKLDVSSKMIALLVGSDVKPANRELAQEIGFLLLKEVSEGLKKKHGI